jgi:hypothetical protein
MQTINSGSAKRFFSFISIIIAGLLIFPALTGAAEKTAKKTDKKPVAKQTKAKKAAPPQAKESPKIDENTARTTFETFTQEWMAKLAEAEEFQRTQRIKVTQVQDGYSAEYEGYLPQRILEVKKTDYEDTPFIGTLTYYQRTLRCTGKTKEQAIQGPFEQVGTSAVREIFRFTKGKWVY